MPAAVAVISGLGVIWSASEMNRANDMQEDALDQQGEILDETQGWAREDRRRYEEVYRPIEDQLIAQSNPTTADYAQATGKANADVLEAFDNVRAQSTRQMARYGVDPTDGRFVSSNRDLDVRQGLAKVGAMNAARTQVKDKADATKLNLLNVGRGLKTDASAGMGTAGAGYGYRAGVYGDQAAGYGAAAGGFMRLGLNSLSTRPSAPTTSGVPGVMPGGQQDSMLTDQWNDGGWNMGDTVGYAEGGPLDRPPIEGEYTRAMEGEVVGPGTGMSDSVPAVVDGRRPVNLSNGEFVVSEDAVRWHGLKNLTKLNEEGKRQGGGYRRALQPQPMRAMA